MFNHPCSGWEANVGITKTKWLEDQDRGWGAPEDKFVCADCVEDEFLKDVIGKNLAKRKCDYCGKRSRRFIAAPVEAIMEPIASAVFYFFNDPTQASVPYDKDFVIEPTYTKDVLFSLPLNCHDDLFEVIADSFTYTDWVHSAGGHWASSHPSEIMSYAWDRFVRDIKHKVRFFFSAIKPDPYDPDGYSPVNTLSTIGEAVIKLGLIQGVSAGEVMYRVRERPSDATWSLDAEQLGAPPKEVVQAQRMNPAGISYLYLAKEKETALAEVLNKPPCRAAIGIFTIRRDLLIIDLSRLPNIPSVFDEEKRDEGELIQFLYKFVDEISKPVSKDGREHVDYVPSQVVCEYFSKVFRSTGGEPIAGIAYPSSVRQGGVNAVLFPPESGQNGFNNLVELTGATEITFDHWTEFSAAIL